MQCKARYCREKKELPFPLEKSYFTETRCPNPTLGKGLDPELCEECQKKAEKPFSPKYQQYQYQGKVDEPYFKMSWIFGSERFLKFHNKPGNALPPDEYARAEAAQKIARQGSEMKEKAAEPKIKHSASAPSLAAPKRAVKETPKNKVVLPQKPVAIPVGVELLDEPLEAMEVSIVKLKRLDIAGTHYWLDTRNQIVYEYGTQGSVGKKIGTWNPDEENLQGEFTGLSTEND